MNLRASVIVPSYGRLQDLLALLEGLHQQVSEPFEVIILDDGSPQPLEQGLGALLRSPVRLIRHDRNQGAGAARNTAISAARGEIIILIDDDSRVDDPGWIQQHLDAHRRGFPKLGIPPGAPHVLHGTVRGLHSSYGGHCFGYSNWCCSTGSRPHRIHSHHAPSNNTSFPVEIWNTVGPMRTDLGMGEDIEWSFRCL